MHWDCKRSGGRFRSLKADCTDFIQHFWSEYKFLPSAAKGDFDKLSLDEALPGDEVLRRCSLDPDNWPALLLALSPKNKQTNFKLQIGTLPGDSCGNAHRGYKVTFDAKFWRPFPQQNNLSWNWPNKRL